MASLVSTNSSSSKLFPPCTQEGCTVDEKEKERVAASAKPSCEMTERCVESCEAYGRICPCSARIAAHAACEAMTELREGSRIFPQVEEATEDDKPDFPYLNADDIVIGKKLGEGGFSNVNVCTVTKGDEAGQEFAVKYLKKKAMVDLHQFKHGAADLATEAYFLNTLDHPHIVKLHGVTAGSVETNVASGKECGFFIVVDRLVDTLEERLEQWRDEHEQRGDPKVGLLRLSDSKQKKRAELLERIKIALAIADAMQYLHDDMGIVYRDLKPDNIGFDESGTLKLFDFGLAKELKPGLEKLDGRYQLTGNTGSRRYMAPEVARECPYNNSVDVYSFGILLWELCSGEKPFFGYSSGKHMQQVVIGNERPNMTWQQTAHWPANLQWLMSRCWSPFPVTRPNFAVIKQTLQDILDGKESVRQASSPVSDPIERNTAILQSPGVLSNLFLPLSRKSRSKTIGSADLSGDAKECLSFPKSPLPKSAGRIRSLSFGLKR